MSRPRQPVEPGYCMHDLPEGQCADARCRPDGKSLQLEHGPGGLPPEPVPVVRTWLAKYNGTDCGNCGHKIEEGQRIGLAFEADFDPPYVCGPCCGQVVE